MRSLSPLRGTAGLGDGHLSSEGGSLLESGGTPLHSQGVGVSSNNIGTPLANYTSMQECTQALTEEEEALAGEAGHAVKKEGGLCRCREDVIVHPTLFLVQLIFSGYHVMTSWALKSKGVDPFVFALYREISASVLIALLAYYAIKKADPSSPYSMYIARRDYLRFGVMGVFSAVNVLGAIYCLSLITPTNFAVMQPSIPVFTMIFSVLCRMERLTWLKAVGLIFAVAGAITVEVIKPKHGGGAHEEKEVSASDFVIGNIVVVLQCVGMAALLVMQKTVLSRYHPTVVVMWYYSLGSIITLIVCLAKRTPLASYSLSSDANPWLALAYAAVFGTAFNYNVYSWAGTVIAPGLIAIYSTIQPIGTAVFSFIIFSMEPTAGEALCGILVIVGLILTVMARQIEGKVATAVAAKRTKSDASGKGPFHHQESNDVQAGLASGEDTLDGNGASGTHPPRL